MTAKDNHSGKHVRVFLSLIEDEEETGEWDMMLDVKLDENNQIAGKWVVFGVLGNLKNTDTLWPFLIRPDGTMDYGVGAIGGDGAERFPSTNIRQRRIAKGELVTVHSSDESEEDVYRIRDVMELGQEKTR